MLSHDAFGMLREIKLLWPVNEENPIKNKGSLSCLFCHSHSMVAGGLELTS